MQTAQSGIAEERPSALRAVAAMAAVMALLHVATNSRYGFHRDELQFLYDSRHLSWGFIAYPPFTAFVEHISEKLFGLSLLWLRMASVLAQFCVVLLAGGMARMGGGSRGAQIVAALMTGFAPYALFQGTEFQYGSFDLLWTMLVAFGVFKLLTTPDSRWWLLVGVAAGLGLQTKYTILFYLSAVVTGFVLSPARRLLATRWFAIALALTILIALPNLLWQVHHHFLSLTFLEHIHARDMGEGRGSHFWMEQILICTCVMALPLWLAGLWRAIRDPRWRPVAIAWALPVVFFALTHARGYYVAPEYPMLLALGTPAVAEWLMRRGVMLRRMLLGLWFVLVAAGIPLDCAFLLPLASQGPLFRFCMKWNGDLREEFGWDRLVTAVAQVRDGLTPQERTSYGIFARNYGELGDLELYGPAAGLPAPIGTVNTAWLLTYPQSPPQTLIVLGYREKKVNELFTHCRLAATIPYRDDISNEESQYGRQIYVCGGPKLDWATFWKQEQQFG